MMAHVSDPFQLQRFVDAQAPVYADVLRELRAGRKTTHWMWFVFPQLAGLGHSATAQRYAISGRDEARAYVEHPVLGRRLIECASIVADLPTADAVAVFGPVDAQKLHSSMTLFATVAPGEPSFGAALARYFSGEPDEATIRRL
jgi:uncharacterized protein (DUF1810 family)